MIMGRFVCFASFMVVCLLIFSPSIRADRVDFFADHTDSFFDNSIHATDANSASFDGDFDDHHGKAWGWRRHHEGDSGNFGDQDNADTDDDGGKTGSTGSGSASTLAVPEPSILVLLSTALAAFFLKSLRRATV